MLRLVATFSDHAATAQLREHYARRLLMLVEALDTVRSQGRDAEQKAATPFFGARHREQAQAAQSTTPPPRARSGWPRSSAENAGEMTPERMAALEKAKAAESDGGEDVLAAAGGEGADGADGRRALDEGASPVAGRRFTRA
jgi:hypothetical protein